MLARDKGIKIITDIEAGIPTCVEGDKYRLKHVLSNLISNGVKFTKHGSTLKVIYQTILFLALTGENNVSSILSLPDQLCLIFYSAPRDPINTLLTSHRLQISVRAGNPYSIEGPSSDKLVTVRKYSISVTDQGRGKSSMDDGILQLKISITWAFCNSSFRWLLSPLI